MSFARSEIFGFDFISASSVEELVNIMMDETVRSDRAEFLITPNAYQVVHFSDRGNRILKDFYTNAKYILPDGMPVVWLSKVLGKGLKERLTGSDLFPVVWAKIKDQNLPVTLVLPSDDIGALFNNEYHACNYLVPGFFKATDADYIEKFAAEVSDAIIENQSRFIFLGLGFPKQELLGIAIEKELKNRGYNKGILFLLLGASFEFYYGLKRRAPAFYRKTGFEWLYRFLQEPGRLWKRYTVDNLRFIGLAIKEIAKKKR